LPEIKSGKYQLLSINNQELNSWLIANKYRVAASTPHGRRYRLSRLISSSEFLNLESIKLIGLNGKIIETKLNWDIELTHSDKCVSGERLSDQSFLIKVNSFWCASNGTDNSREKIFQNFRNEFDETVKLIGLKDKVILDLRSNGGGADLEVEYLLNSFFDHPVSLYSYQHLMINVPGPIKSFLRLLPWDFHLWAKKKEEYTSIKNSSPYQLYKNELHVLVSAGCFSSCEVVAQALKFEKRGALWGSQTHGGAGDPYLFPIGNSILSINLPTCLVWQKNGEFFEGVGVTPDFNYLPLLSIDGDDLLVKVVQYKN
jgi:hypothetical protein